MDDSEIRRRVLAQFGLKIEPEMSRYLGRRLTSGGATRVAVRHMESEGYVGRSSFATGAPGRSARSGRAS